VNILLILSTLFMVHAVEKTNGDVYDLEGKTKLFTYESERTFTADAMDFTATFKDLNGKVATTEKAHIDKGNIVKYEVENLQTNDKGLIEVQGDKIVFTYWNNGKSSTKKEDVKPNMLISANLVPYLQTQFKELMAKKDIEFKYAVWYRKELVGFKFMYDKEENGNVIAKMVPTNFLYRSMVNPLYFALDKTSKKLVYIKGRTLPKIQIKGTWRDLDAYIKYH
jgi:hypothetical protein